MQSTDYAVILGGFNTPDINWSTMSANSLFSSELWLNFPVQLCALIDHPTHIHGSVLDLLGLDKL